MEGPEALAVLEALEALAVLAALAALAALEAPLAGAEEPGSERQAMSPVARREVSVANARVRLVEGVRGRGPGAVERVMAREHSAGESLEKGQGWAARAGVLAWRPCPAV
ncbi:uncharacterized protein CMC5_046880 [Chondromyces crocatus]|uniref:Uncharacterized protein n=1 Tax=Chondromyces crocatus TaxID=52 RepID=A0A0K1EIW2_CHOCO|nr:uncharacterized protein CMC5_046880 [Chondromyces crocatus]